jgi:hypothetical protein
MFKPGDLVVCREPFTMFFDEGAEQLELIPALLNPGDVGVFLGAERAGDMSFMFGNAILWHWENHEHYSVSRISDCVEVVK